MNRTQNYNLCQWEAADKVQRTDFNEDNRKIEAAILAARKAPCCVTGTYVGNQESVTVDVGFRPGFLVVMSGQRGTPVSANTQAIFGGEDRLLAIRQGTSNHYYPYCEITDTGFVITDAADTGMLTRGLTFRYFAFY